MIKYYQWQGHPSAALSEGNCFYVIKLTRTRKNGRDQYLGWFYTSRSDELHFDTRLNHSARPDLLEDVEPNISNDKLQQMIIDIFSYDPGDI